MIKARSSLLLTLAVAAMLPGTVYSEDQPIVIARPSHSSYLSLDPLHGSIGVTGLYSADSSGVGGHNVNTSDLLLTQDLTLATGGSIVSPNLFHWSASGTASFEEEWSSSPDGDQSRYGIFETYDIEGNLLNATQFPMSAYARRSESFVNRAFAALLRDVTTGYGASASYNSAYIPFNVNYNHSTTEQTNFDGANQFIIDQDDLNFSTQFELLDRHHFTANYAYSSVSQNNPGLLTQDSSLQTAAATHFWNIDSAGRYNLTESFDYSQQTGSFPATRLHLGEQFRFHPFDTLDGGVTYGLDRQEYTTSDITSQNISANLTHHLYESLVSTAQVGASFTDSTFIGQSQDLNTRSYYGSVGTNYTKKLWIGRVGANVSLGYSQSENNSVSQVQPILGDVQSFTDPQPIVLTRAGVDPNSVAVFDATGTRQFVNGVDYTVRTVGDTVQIDRVVGGNIAAGDTVRLNYDILPLPGYSSDSVSFGTGANYAFDEGFLRGLNLYARYYQINQTISPASSLIQPNDIRDTIFGADYRFWKITLTAEDEHHDSTLAPFSALRFTGRYADSLGERTHIFIDVNQSFIHYPADHSDTNFTSVDGRLAYQISRDLRSSISLLWRNEEETRIGNTVGFEQQADLTWRIRQTNVFALIRHTSLDSNNSNNESFFFQFGISRSF